jgi:acyl carrier protein
MGKEYIIKLINGLLIKEFEIEEKVILPEARLKDDIGLESLDFVDIAVLVKKELNINMTGKDVSSIKTVGDLYDYIYNHIQKK